MTDGVECAGYVCDTSKSSSGRGTPRTSTARPAPYFPAGDVRISRKTSSTSIGLPADKVRVEIRFRHISVVFIIKNLIDLDLSDEIDPVRCPMKKNTFLRFITVMHTITSLYPIIPQSLWLTIWNWLLERLRHMRADLDLIVNAEHFARIDRIFDYERSHCNVCTFSSTATMVVFLIKVIPLSYFENNFTAE